VDWVVVGHPLECNPPYARTRKRKNQQKRNVQFSAARNSASPWRELDSCSIAVHGTRRSWESLSLSGMIRKEPEQEDPVGGNADTQRRSGQSPVFKCKRHTVSLHRQHASQRAH
jgi:hypothetical protein